MRTDAIASWIFDLDNTLYPAECELFTQIDLRMGEYISAVLGVDKAAARRLQKSYYHQHGTTLRGLMLQHRVEPEDYLAFVHDIDLSPISRAPALGRALAALPGARYVFTNGPAAHVERVLTRLGIAELFDGVFDIAAADYVPKPHPEAYDRLIEAFAFDARAATLFEDSLANLAPAAERGMVTVWVRRRRADLVAGADGEVPAHVDHVTDDLVACLEGLAAKR
jgi:putative hydrolase of the HAD superfamily